MGYFKFTKQDEIIDVAESPVWVKQDVRGRIVRCDVKDAMGVLSSDEETVYHIAGTKKFSSVEYEEIFVSDVTEQEYTELRTIMQLGGTVTEDTIIWEQPQVEEPVVQEGAELPEVKARYLSGLSAACQAAIFEGFDVRLSDGSTYHFDLALEDQLNLITLSAMVAEGATEIPYHASGRLCEYFSAEDFLCIVAAANAHKTYHTAYYNSLKNWVMSMNSIAEVCAVNYGDAVPEEYCSSVYLRLEGVKNS